MSSYPKTTFVAAALGLACLAGCGESHSVKLDGTTGAETSILPDGALPDMSITPDAALVDGSTSDQPAPDHGVDLWPDTMPPDLLAPDSGDGKTCAAAKLITLSAGKATVSGDTSSATDTINLTYSSCTTKSTPGPDLFYVFQAAAGKAYRVAVQGSFNAALYVFKSCANPAGTCVGGSDYTSSSSYKEEVVFTASAAGAYLIGVDSSSYPSSSYSKGYFTLTIEEYTPPTNDTCTSATKLTFSSGAATVSGDTTSASNTLNLPYGSSSCTYYSTPGADLFYSFPATAGKLYKISLTTTSWNASLYVLSSCNSPTTSCVAGADKIYSSSGTEVAVFSPSTSGTYVIGVDSRYTTQYPSPSSGPFTLKVEELTAPSNNGCAGATALSFSGGKASVSGDTSLATNSVDLPYTGCTAKSTPGPDLFYSFTAAAGKGYKVTLVTKYNAAVYVLSGCSSPTTSCVAGADVQSSSYGGTEKLLFSPKTAGTYVIGVDSRYGASGSSLNAGSFTLTVEEFTPPANNSCAGATTLTFSGGKASVSGDTSLATNDVDLPYTSCTKYVTPGADLFYSFMATAGKVYKVSLQTSYNSAVYVLSACASPATSCVAGADYSYSSSETLVFAPKTSGSYTIGVDSRYPSSYYSPSTGAFTLTVEEHAAPGNMTCANPKALTFSGTKATVAADTSLSSNDLSGIKCSGGYAFEGPQLYYKASLTKGKRYLVTLKPGQSYDAVLYAFPSSTSCSAYTINPACFYTYSAKGYSGKDELVIINPTVSGDWTIVVDSTDKLKVGPFVLTVEEIPVPANDTCSGAKALAFATGVNTVIDVGQTFSAVDDVDLGYGGCTGQTTAGGEVFYKIQLSPPYSYTIALAPQNYNGALYLLSGCTSPASSCVAGADKSSYYYTETVTFKPTTSQAYYIGVDGRTAADVGTYTLTVNRQ